MTSRFPFAETPDFETSELGRKLFAGPCDFLKGVEPMLEALVELIVAHFSLFVQEEADKHFQIRS